jgi:hypothetical protein
MFMGRDWETISPLWCMAGEDMSEESKPIRAPSIHWISIMIQ